MPAYRAIITVIDHLGQSQTAGGEWVYETEESPVRTGLLNAAGTPIYRMPEVRRIGFDLSRQHVKVST